MHLLITMTHGPEMCAFNDPQRRERAQQATTKLQELAASHDTTVHAAFTDVVDHHAWLYVEAPSPETAERILLETGMFAQNNCQIRVVRPMQEAAAMLGDLDVG